MPDQSVLSISQEQRSLIDEALLKIAPAQFQRGTELLMRNAVGKLKWNGDGRNRILTRVKGGEHYPLELAFVDGNLSVHCACPFNGLCKHLAAVILRMRMLPVDEKGEEMPATPLETTGELRSAIIHRVSENLPRQTLRFLNKAQAWWETKERLINLNSLKEACGERAHWHAADFEIFPAETPPADAVEYFTCLIITCQSKGLKVPKPLEEAVDAQVRQRIERSWNRLGEIKKWKSQLDKWDDPETTTAAPDVDFRLQLFDSGAVVQMRLAGEANFQNAHLKTTVKYLDKALQTRLNLGSQLVIQSATDEYNNIQSLEIKPLRQKLCRGLAQLSASREIFKEHVVGQDGLPLQIFDEALHWEITTPGDSSGDYQLALVDANGHHAPAPVAILYGKPLRYVTSQAVYPIPFWPFGEECPAWPIQIPAPAMESRQGLGVLGKLGIPLPGHMAQKVRLIKAAITVVCRIYRYHGSKSDYFQFCGTTDFEGHEKPVIWSGTSWWNRNPWDFKPKPESDGLVQIDKSAMAATADWLALMPNKQATTSGSHFWLEQRITGKDWPEQFLAWLDRKPEGCIVELDGQLASLRNGQVAGHVQIDIEDSKDEIDWFDLSVALHVNDSTLTQEEIDLLLKAKGKWVRLEGKGWRKLEYQLTEDQLKELADLGLSVNDFSNEKQRLHALQLAGLTKKTTSLLGSERVAQVRRRVEEIQTRVTPPAPDAITATLRPYQLEGFHFLAYLTANNFGGVLADDMGLGKTLQALSWIAWLRKEEKITEPVLVVCPKSVQDNWANECRKFFPELKVEIWSRASAGKTGLDKSVDLLVIHYPQLRSHEDALRAVSWGAVILDEAQAIKNPISQSAKAACALPSKYRLALSGTPIENRLLDLWSIFAFAMPGALGNRTAFTKQFDKKDDPFARRRLAARTRPFLLRRTKNEVARDLPDRVEEDLVVEFEGIQSDLYKAEIKRARAQLLKIETSKQLDKMRFNILTSLLRLRQICCHPRLLGLEDAKKKKSTDEDSAKLSALLELLEPLMEEGQKVLVFSQFVEMLEIIESEIKARDWKTFKLTGETDDRGPLVDSFQKHEGSAVFLISLKAGGSGLNLTAASYVVLFDPWWNPAVEAQAIDRTHRIGQKQTVFAYRLLIKGTIEEKIRLLQKKKGALANDILGEENFARALTLEDFNFLFGDPAE